jgi:hypothetical protein
MLNQSLIHVPKYIGQRNNIAAPRVVRVFYPKFHPVLFSVARKNKIRHRFGPLTALSEQTLKVKQLFGISPYNGTVDFIISHLQMTKMLSLSGMLFFQFFSRTFRGLLDHIKYKRPSRTTPIEYTNEDEM